MTLHEFLLNETQKPFCWGDTDCASTADRWVQHAVGVSPLERYGRVYFDRQSALSWLAEPGGFAVAVNRVMRRSGFRKTDNPQSGDIGLIIHDGLLMMAVLTPNGWFSRNEDGVVMRERQAMWKAWAIK